MGKLNIRLLTLDQIPPDPAYQLSDGKWWGQWQLDYKTFTLTLFLNGQEWYCFKLNRFTHSAEMLDMIFQVKHKTWASNDVIADFIAALDAIFFPQENLCSSGMDRTINPRQVFQKRLAEKT
jgi:hypothetical protein